jgi:transposase
MTLHAALDVSDKVTGMCLVDGHRAMVRRDLVASDPDVLAKWLKRHGKYCDRNTEYGGMA